MTARQSELIAKADRVLVKNYRQQPVVLERGRGAEVWDVDGRRYLDMTAGIAVCCLGHAHPAFTARMTEQLSKLTQVSNLYFNDQQILEAVMCVGLAKWANYIGFGLGTVPDYHVRIDLEKSKAVSI